MKSNFHHLMMSGCTLDISVTDIPMAGTAYLGHEVWGTVPEWQIPESQRVVFYRVWL